MALLLLEKGGELITLGDEEKRGHDLVHFLYIMDATICFLMMKRKGGDYLFVTFSMGGKGHE